MHKLTLYKFRAQLYSTNSYEWISITAVRDGLLTMEVNESMWNDSDPFTFIETNLDVTLVHRVVIIN